MEASYDLILDDRIRDRFRNERTGRRGERYLELDPDDDFGDPGELENGWAQAL